MPELIAKPAFDHAAITHGTCRLELVELGPITSVTLFPGQEKAVAKVLKPMGLSFPAPNSLSSGGAAQLVWTGRDQAFLIGVEAALEGVVTTDQSDGWACLRLEGAGVDQALMRLYPLDLRPAAFPVGTSARAPLNHMGSVLMRVEAEAFEILVFRSMARSAWTEIAEAMLRLDARAEVA